MKLKLAEGLILPVDAVTQAIGILAKRRAGKSYTARRFAEQLFKAGQQIVIVDPKGDWWGIRSAADGKSPGLPIVILGGERGDIPLEVGGGEIVARLVTEERVSVLLDLSLFRKHEVATFMTSFLENLYRLKAREQFRTPLMLIIDEADAIAPQKPQENEARMLGAAEDIVRRGGQRGIGCMLITQRSAVLNKNVLTQVEMMVALRTIAPQDLKAMDAWIEVHGEKAERDTLMASLPALPVGDAWFWSPGWPTTDGIFQRVHVYPIETFDSGASPKAGEKRIEPKNLADVDLGSLTKQMSATIEKAKENDPKLLKSEIARLKKELATKSNGNGHAATKEKLVIDTSAIDKAVARALAAERRRWQPTMIRLERDLTGVYRTSQKLSEGLQSMLAPLSDAIHSESAPIAVAPEPVRAAAPAAAAAPVRRAVAQAEPVQVGDVVLSGTQQRMLDALAQYHQLGVEWASRAQVAGFLAVSHTTGTFKNNLSVLRTAGLIHDAQNGDVSLTPAGHKIARLSDPPSLSELHQMWYQKLGGTQAKMLEQIITAHPGSITREDIAAALGVQSDTGTFKNNLSKLRTLGLITDVSRTEVQASAVVYPEGLY
jgi:Mn-dependent DtxR family transcriptional regulator